MTGAMARAAAFSFALALALCLAGCGRGGPQFQTSDVTGAAMGRDFALTDHNGKARTLADFRGKVVVIFFGYTQCPDVCPTTLATFKQVWAKLREAGIEKKVAFDFISVDPERDTPEQLAKYVGYFSKDFVAATGTDAELTKLTRALGLVYAREPSANGDYTVDHSASAVIIDPAGRQTGLFRPPFDAAKIAADLQALAASG